MSEKFQKIMIVIEPNDNGDLYAQAAYDFGKGLQSNVLSHEYADKADILSNIQLEAGSDIEGVICQRVPGTDKIKQYYVQSKPETQSIINFINVIKQIATRVGLSVYVSDWTTVVFANKYDLKRLDEDYELSEDELEDELSGQGKINNMLRTKNKKLGRTQ